MIAKLKGDDEPNLDDARALVHDALVWILQYAKRDTPELRHALPAELSLRLQRAIFQFGAMYREAEMGPERMLVDLKDVFKRLDASVPAPVRDQLSGQIVRWCISAYYVEPGT